MIHKELIKHKITFVLWMCHLSAIVRNVTTTFLNLISFEVVKTLQVLQKLQTLHSHLHRVTVLHLKSVQLRLDSKSYRFIKPAPFVLISLMSIKFYFTSIPPTITRPNFTSQSVK